MACKLLYLVKWSQLEIANSIQELMHFMTEANPNYMKGVEQVIQHVLCTPKRGLVMQPDGIWDGGREYQFQINGISDSGMEWNETHANNVGAYKYF